MNSYTSLRISTYWLRRLFNFAVLIAILTPSIAVFSMENYQTSAQVDDAERLLERLTAEERVGQLFLTSFQNMDVGTETQIYDLISTHHIGGVVLSATNDNFSDSEDILSDILNMNRQLQLNRWSSSQQTQRDPVTGEIFTPTFIPLFIGISQEGDGYPYDQILSNLTQIPNAMALGATWNETLVFNTGNILGEELSALGVNLYFGPSLDVLEDPQPIGANDLGTRAFGGDPYWVGKMGQTFISSIHQGSQGRIAVIAKHFPGIGAADRLPVEEVATVRKSLEQLVNFDLVPFFNVTGNVVSSDATADGLLVSHIRYQGFQGNIRASTRPISLDLQAFSQLMALPALTEWRDSGGVMICDNLGTQSVQRFYELTNPNQPFDARRVALNAFLAGNDLIYLGNITSSSDPDPYTTALNIMAFFNQRYREDPAFAQRVDESVLRILRLKNRLYPEFNLEQILPSLDGVESLGKSDQIVFEVAREAATLISPTITELETALPDTPNATDRITFITDTRKTRQCSNCVEQPVLAVDSLQQAILRLYGTQSGGQIRSSNLNSYSFEDLIELLDGDEDAFQFERDLRRSQWIIFSMQDITESYPSSHAIYRFLSERPDLLQSKKLIVFAFNAPYFLDATDISKLTAFYGLYSKVPAFIDVAARLLFKEINPHGSLPVSVVGVGYDLISATMPDPNQTIPLSIDLPSETPPAGTSTPEPIPTPIYNVGDIISVKAGVIIDHNGNPVPDGTPIQFIVTVNGEISSLPQTEITQGGIATMNISVPSSGTMEIRVESEPAKTSEILHFEVPDQNGQEVTATPTEVPTSTPTETPLPTPTTTAVVATQETTSNRPNLLDWSIAILISVSIGFIAYRTTSISGQVRWGVRGGFLAVIGGLLFYSLLTLGENLGRNPMQSSGVVAVIIITIIGSIMGIIATWGWKSLTDSRIRNSVSDRT